MTQYLGIQALEALPPWDGKRLCRIETAARILAELGNPQDQVKSVHVAGTNGKGSVCAAIAACLWAGGSSVGQFASPHLSHVTERCILNGRPVSMEAFNRSVNLVFAACERLGETASYFVIGMIASFLEFAEHKVDWMVIEVGVGGLWDATNTIAAPRASVITHIGYDHTHLLGTALEEITANKAGIIKPNCPVFVGANDPRAVEVCRRTARDKSAPWHCYGEEFWFDAVLRKVVWHGGSFTFSADSELLDIPARIENTVLAVRTAAALGCSREAVELGLRTVRWPGRMEQFSFRAVDSDTGRASSGADFNVAIDGMHNIDGAPVVVQFLRSVVEKKPQLKNILVVFAMREGKDWAEVVQLLAAGIDALPEISGSIEWIFTGMDLSGMTPPANFKRILPQGEVVPRSRDALERALHSVASRKAEADTLVLITGSLYLLGELRPILSSEPFSTIDFSRAVSGLV